MKDTIDHAERHLLLLRLIHPTAAQAVSTLEAVLEDIQRVYGLKDLGIRWPASTEARLNVHCGEGECPTWNEDHFKRLAALPANEYGFVDAMQPDLRLMILRPEHRPAAVLWAVRAGNHPWNDMEASALDVVASLLAKHPALLERVGSRGDQAHILQRLQDASVVAGRIAHDFDNIFTGVVGFADIVLPMLEPGSMAHQYVAEISAAGNRGIQFTQQLHQLSRSGGAKPMPCSLSTVVAKEETRLRRANINHVRIQTQVPADLPTVAIEAGTLQSLLAILLDNAFEASPPRGIVRVTASLVEISAIDASDFLGNITAGPYVEVRISDEGSGIRPEHRNRMFVEPFFTTKIRHRGLGLTIVFRILHAHRGGVRIESGGERGTSIVLVLPLAAARHSDTPPNGPEALHTHGDNTT